MLVLLNTYPLLQSQTMVFQSKETSMKSSVKLIEASLSGLKQLDEENVSKALTSMRETGVSRILVTDTAGRILYDTPDGRMHLFCKVRVIYGEPMPAAQFAMESRRDLKTLRANKQALLDAWEELGQQA